MRGRTDRWWLLVLTAGALAGRLALALATDRDELGFNDQFLYHHMAEGLARGDGYQIFGEPTLRWPPAYPFLLSLVYRAFGTDPGHGLVLNAVLSAASVPLTYLIARRVSSQRAAVGAGAAVALLPGQWLFSATLLTEPLATLQILLVLAVAVLMRPSPAAGLLLGGLVASAALTRGEGPLLLLVAAVAWWSRDAWRQILGALAVASAVTALLVVPWIVRNSRIAGERVGMSLNFAETLYAGHNPDADGGATYADAEVLEPTRSVPPGPERELAQARILSEAAREWALDNPGREMVLIPLRILHLLEGDGNVVSVWIEAGDDDVLGPWEEPLEVAADAAWYGLLAALVVAALRRGRLWLREPWSRAALVLPITALGLYGVVLYGNFRYRIPYEPLLVLLVASAVTPRSQPAGSNQTATVPRLRASEG